VTQIFADITSHSRLEKYEKCPQLYHREYNLKKRFNTSANYFIIGSNCHSALEFYYTDAVYPHPLAGLDHVWKEWLAKHQLGHLLPELRSYKGDMEQMWFRASAACTDPHIWIRKADKTVADAPHMTKGWKDAVKSLGFEQRSFSVDQQARNQLGAGYENVSLSTCYSETYEILKNYQDPEILASVDHIEYSLSERVFVDKVVVDVLNPVLLPSGLYMNGKIDLVGTAHDGRVVLLDHKTSSGDPPHERMVTHHEQLLKYAWAWNQLHPETKLEEMWIGISHLRSGTCVVVRVDPEAALAAVMRSVSVIEAIDAGAFPKRDPLAYNSPCLKLDKSSGSITEYCPHILECHPGVARTMGLL
jgi:hypothetical protein